MSSNLRAFLSGDDDDVRDQMSGGNRRFQSWREKDAVIHSEKSRLEMICERKLQLNSRVIRLQEVQDNQEEQ